MPLPSHRACRTWKRLRLRLPPLPHLLPLALHCRPPGCPKVGPWNNGTITATNGWPPISPLQPPSNPYVHNPHPPLLQPSCSRCLTTWTSEACAWSISGNFLVFPTLKAILHLDRERLLPPHRTTRRTPLPPRQIQPLQVQTNQVQTNHNQPKHHRIQPPQSSNRPPSHPNPPESPEHRKGGAALSRPTESRFTISVSSIPVPHSTRPRPCGTSLRTR